MAGRQLVACRVGGTEYAFEIEYVREIIRDGARVRLAAGEPAMLGIVDLRGVAMPVYDLAAALGMGAVPGGSERSDDRRIVVTAADEASGPVGWLVDGVDEVLGIDTDQIEPLDRAGSRVVRRVARSGSGRLLPLLDVDELLATYASAHAA